jgi:TolA-binding protein
VGFQVSEARAKQLYGLLTQGGIAWEAVSPFIDKQGRPVVKLFADEGQVTSLAALNNQLTALQNQFATNNGKITELNKQIANVRKQIDQGKPIPVPTVPAQ